MDAPAVSGAVLSEKTIKPCTHMGAADKSAPTRPVQTGQGTGFIRFMSLEQRGPQPGRTHEDLPAVARLSRRAKPATGPMKRARSQQSVLAS